MVGLTFTGITGAYATAPLCFLQETAFAADPSGTPTYTAVKLSENTNFDATSVDLDILAAGMFDKYSVQTGGRNYAFHLDIQPQDIDFIKIGMNVPSLTSPNLTAVSSYQFLQKYKQSYGTAELADTWLFALGARPSTTTLSVTPQQKVMCAMDWIPREYKFYSVSPLTAETGVPSLGSITGPVLVDADAGTNTPLTIDGDDYPTDGFSVTVDLSLQAKAYNGSGLIDLSAPGTRQISGSINVPVGANGLALETIVNSQQTGVDIDYLFKTGTAVLHLTGCTLSTMGRAFPGNADSILQNPVSFKAASAEIATV